MKKLLIIFSLMTVLAVAFIFIVSTRRTISWEEWVNDNIPSAATPVEEFVTTKKMRNRNWNLNGING